MSIVFFIYKSTDCVLTEENICSTVVKTPPITIKSTIKDLVSSWIAASRHSQITH